MGHWYAIVPRPDLYELYNYIKNPSFENNVTDGWQGTGTTPVQESGYAVHGRYCCKIPCDAGYDWIDSDYVKLEDDETAVASAYVRNNIGTGAAVSVAINDLTNGTIRAQTDLTTTSGWTRLVATWKNELGSSVNIEVRIGNLELGGTANVYVDAVQLIIYKTTAPAADCVELDYFDGDSDDAYWMGEPHNSKTKINEDTHEHGQVLSLDTDLGLEVDSWSGTGLPSYQLITTDWAQDAGGYVQRARARSRTVIMRSTLTGSSLANLYAKRLALVEALRPDLSRRNQPLRLFHLLPGQSYGDPDWRELRVYYDSGLEMQSVRGYLETLTLRLIAPDPYFYQERSTWGTLDPRDTPTDFEDFAARIDGEWINIPNANPNGTINYIYASKALGKVFILGTFTNWNNVAAADYIVAYDPNRTLEDATQFEALGTGLNDEARFCCDGPDGCLYVVGDFTSAGGVTTYKVAKWDGSSWSAMCTTAPTSGDVYGCCWGEEDDGAWLYICGDFVDFNGETYADGVAKWASSTWSVMGYGISGGTVPGRALAWDGQHSIYVVGDLTLANKDGAPTVTVYGIARYDGLASASDPWFMVGDSDATHPGLYGSATADAIVSDGKGNLYLAGNFNYADDLWCEHAARYDGRAFHTLGGLAMVYSWPNKLWYDDDAEELYVFNGTNYGQLQQLDSIGVWNGVAWHGIGWEPPALNRVAGAVMYGNLFVGCETDGTTYQEGVATLTNDGTERAWPIITIEAGQGDRILKTVRNLTTGVELHFYTYIQPYGKVVIDTRPGRRAAKDLLGRNVAMTAGSSLSDFFLVPGPNRIAIYVDNIAGTYDVTARAEWQTIYGSAD